MPCVLNNCPWLDITQRIWDIEVDRRGRPKVWIFYHVFHPSANVSARHLTDLSVGLAELGWDVTAFPSNRDYPDGSITFPSRDEWRGVRINRVWRPNFRQSSNFGRLANAAWMITAWAFRALTFSNNRPQAVIIGTDPILSVLAALAWKMTRPKTIVAHWGFDLYPEAPIADGMMAPGSFLARFVKGLLRPAYGACDLIVDIGPCMKQRFAEYSSRAKSATITPWALVEPPSVTEPDAIVRQELFGDAKLGLLYSGTFGRAHSYQEFLALARSVRDASIAFCFAGRGNRTEQLREAISPDDTNIRFAGFASEEELEKRLGAADIHMASLRPEWTGAVVPSKFFGSLAAGRPVLFAGAPESALAKWIHQHQVGWVMANTSTEQLATILRDLATRPQQIASMKVRCHQIYQQYFARERMINQWNTNLRKALVETRGQP